jgi:hypothetical protein
MDTDMLSWVDKNGRLVTQSQLTILKALQCSANEKAIDSLDNHHELVSKALESIGKISTKTSGILGSRFSTKYKVVTLLDQYMKENPILTTTELKEAVNQIYNYPLREQAKFTLGQMLKRNDDVNYFVDYITDVYKANQLCIVLEEGSGKDDRVVCSMGLKNL